MSEGDRRVVRRRALGAVLLVTFGFIALGSVAVEYPVATPALVGVAAVTTMHQEATGPVWSAQSGWRLPDVGAGLLADR